VEDFSCTLDILYGGLGISKVKFWSKKAKLISAVFFFLLFFVIKTLDPDWIRIRIRIGSGSVFGSGFTWNAGSGSMNPDPQHWIRFIYVWNLHECRLHLGKTSGEGRVANRRIMQQIPVEGCSKKCWNFWIASVRLYFLWGPRPTPSWPRTLPVLTGLSSSLAFSWIGVGYLRLDFFILNYKIWINIILLQSYVTRAQL